MKVCPKCGHVDRTQFRTSRFEYDQEYMRFDEAKADYPQIYEALKDKPNQWPLSIGEEIYYRRGTGGLWLYRCLKENFKMPRERKTHKVKPK